MSRQVRPGKEGDGMVRLPGEYSATKHTTQKKQLVNPRLFNPYKINIKNVPHPIFNNKKKMPHSISLLQ